MNLRDTLILSFSTVVSYPPVPCSSCWRWRWGAAVVVLTALATVARRYVVGQFSSLGTNLIIVLPGRAETSGGFPGAALGQTPRDLTLEDARFVGQLPQVRRYAPLNVGVAELTAGGRLREVTVLGSTSELLPIRHMTLSQGSFLAHGSERSAQIVLGSQLAREFFPDGKAIGQRIRLGDSRFLVSGVLAVQGESMGFNSDEIAIIPIDYAQELFNTSTLFRILVEARSPTPSSRPKAAISHALKLRHDGEEDVTVITQEPCYHLRRILTALTLGVAGIAAISLAVAGILVMNVMLVAVAHAHLGNWPAESHRRTRRRYPPPVLCRGAVAIAGVRARDRFALGHFGAWMRASPIRCSPPGRRPGPAWQAWPPPSSPAILASLRRPRVQQSSTRACVSVKLTSRYPALRAARPTPRTGNVPSCPPRASRWGIPRWSCSPRSATASIVSCWPSSPSSAPTSSTSARAKPAPTPSVGAIGSARLLTIEDSLALKASRYAQYTNAG